MSVSQEGLSSVKMYFTAAGRSDNRNDLAMIDMLGNTL